MLVAHDITAVTEAERERERIAAVASHELRHPLTVIIGWALGHDNSRPIFIYGNRDCAVEDWRRNNTSG